MKLRIPVIRRKGEETWRCATCATPVEGQPTKNDQDTTYDYGYLDMEWKSGGCVYCGAFAPRQDEPC